jgi:hypothetical protein
VRKVLVCGGRNYQEWSSVQTHLGILHSEDPFSHVIHGDALGADRLAAHWARTNKVQEVACPANWDGYGKAAGVLRNKAMLALGPDLVVAFPGGTGTQHMIDLALKAGVEVQRCE